MPLNEFIERVKNLQPVTFADTMAIISEHYLYQPTEFSNGLVDPLLNEAGRNEGSCKIFAFAKLHRLDQPQTLGLFGDYYHKEVLQNPTDDDHQNIRRFMRDGWAGLRFSGEALQAR